MYTVEEIIDQVRRLPRQDQQSLERLEELLDQDRMVEQLSISEGPYPRSLALAGTTRTKEESRR